MPVSLVQFRSSVKCQTAVVWFSYVPLNIFLVPEWHYLVVTAVESAVILNIRLF